MMVGGLSELKPADGSINSLVQKMRPQAETKLGHELHQFKAVSYRTQLVNGTNYFVKVQTEDGYLHLRIYQSIRQETTQLVAIRTDESLDSEITYF